MGRIQNHGTDTCYCRQKKKRKSTHTYNKDSNSYITCGSVLRFTIPAVGTYYKDSNLAILPVDQSSDSPSLQSEHTTKTATATLPVDQSSNSPPCSQNILKRQQFCYITCGSVLRFTIPAARMSGGSCFSCTAQYRILDS